MQVSNERRNKFLMRILVEVYKTNVLMVGDVEMLLLKLAHHFPTHKINFDLDDCFKILRLKGNAI